MIVESQLYHKEDPSPQLFWIMERTPKERGKRVPMIHCLPIFPSPRAIYASTSVYIFLTTFFSFESGSLFSIRPFRSTVFVSRSRCARAHATPQKLDISGRKKRAKKARIRYTREGRSTKRANGA